MKRNYSADSVRFIASIAVTLMHVANYMPVVERATYWNYYWYFPILDLAVPLFFAMAGFFKANKELNHFPAYGVKLLTISIAYSCFYLLFYWPIDILSQWRLGNTGLAAFSHYFKEGFFINTVLGIVSSEHLWFLMALFYAVVVYYCLKRLSLTKNQILWFSVVAYLLTFTAPFAFLRDNLLLYGGFVKGLFYFMIGLWIGDSQFKLKIKKSYLLLPLVLLIIGDALTESLLFRECLLALVTFSVLLYVANNPGNKTVLSRLGKHSLAIYLLHYLFVGGFNVLATLFPILLDIPDIVRIPSLTAIAVVGSIMLYPITDYLFYRPVDWFFNKILS